MSALSVALPLHLWHARRMRRETLLASTYRAAAELRTSGCVSSTEEIPGGAPLPGGAAIPGVGAMLGGAGIPATASRVPFRQPSRRRLVVAGAPTDSPG